MKKLLNAIKNVLVLAAVAAIIPVVMLIDNVTVYLNYFF